MVAMQAGHESVFTVLDAAARRRGPISLALQHLATLAVILAIVVLAPQWWSIACLLGAGAMYSLWGLTAHTIGEAAARPVRVGFAAVGATLAIAGTIGLAMALFTGTGKSPYNACGEGATDKRCEALARPPKGSGPIVP
jgi:hypothetical protein